MWLIQASSLDPLWASTFNVVGGHCVLPYQDALTLWYVTAEPRPYKRDGGAILDLTFPIFIASALWPLEVSLARWHRILYTSCLSSDMVALVLVDIKVMLSFQRR